MSCAVYSSETVNFVVITIMRKNKYLLLIQENTPLSTSLSLILAQRHLGIAIYVFSCICISTAMLLRCFQMLENSESLSRGLCLSGPGLCTLDGYSSSAKIRPSSYVYLFSQFQARIFKQILCTFIVLFHWCRRKRGPAVFDFESYTCRCCGCT